MNKSNDFLHYVDPEGKSFLLSNNKNFLHRTARTLKTYSSHFSEANSFEVIIKKFDSSAIEAFQCSLLLMPESVLRKSAYSNFYFKESIKLLEKARVSKFLYYLNISDFLTPFANRLIYYSNVKQEFYIKIVHWNCHSMALGLSGVFKGNYLLYDYNQFLGLKEVSKEELEPGDIINFSSKNHSIIYLNDQICFSCNGMSNQLKIYHLDEVLLIYGIEEINTSEIKYYKKPSYFENIYELIFKQIDLLICYQEYLFEHSFRLIHDQNTISFHKQSVDLMKNLFVECFNHDVNNLEYFKLIFLACAMRHASIAVEQDSNVLTYQEFITLAHATFLGLVAYSDSLVILNDNHEKIKQYQHLIYQDESLVGFDIHYHKLQDIVNLDYASYSSLQIDIMLYLIKKFEIISGEYENYQITKIDFVKKIRETIHRNFIFGYTSYNIKNTLSYHYLFSLAFIIDYIFWFIDPYRLLFGKRLSILKCGQPISLTELECIENEIDKIDKKLLYHS